MPLFRPAGAAQLGRLVARRFGLLRCMAARRFRLVGPDGRRLAGGRHPPCPLLAELGAPRRQLGAAALRCGMLQVILSSWLITDADPASVRGCVRVRVSVDGQ